MNRRGFLGAILAAAAAPAIVRADSLMRIVPRELAVASGPVVWETGSLGGFLAPQGLMAQLYDNMALCVCSMHFPNWKEGDDIVFPAVTGNDISSIALLRNGDMMVIREAIGLPITPNGGDIVLVQ